MTATEAEALRLMDRISDLNRRRFVPVIERVLAEFDRPGTTIQIDKLDVALGTIPADQLEVAVERLEPALREVLTRALEAIQGLVVHSASANALPSDAAALPILERYLRDGIWPYDGRGTASAPVALFESILTAEPAAIAALLRRHADHPYVLARLARQAPSTVLELLLRTLAGDRATAILASLNDARDALHDRIRVRGFERTVGPFLWELVLEHILREDVDNLPHLIASQVAGHSDASIRSDVVQRLIDREPAPHHALEKPSLAATSRDGAARVDFQFFADPGTDDLAVVPDGASSMLERFLRHGEHPALRVDELILELAADDPDDLARLFRSYARSEAVLRHVAELIGEKGLEALLTALDPKSAATIILYVVETRRLHRAEPVVPLSEPTFAQLLSYIALRHVLYEAGSHFNRRSFLVVLIEDIALEQALTYSEVLSALYRGVLETAKAEPLAGSFPEIIAELARDLESSEGFSSAAGVPDRSGSSSAVFGALEQLLAADESGSAELTQTLAAAHQRDAVAFSGLVRRLLLRTGARLLRRLSRILAFPVVLRLLLPPSFAGELAELTILLKLEAADRNVSADAVELAVLVVLAGEADRSKRTLILAKVLRSIAALVGVASEELIVRLSHRREKWPAVDDIVALYDRHDLLRHIVVHGAFPWRALLAEPGLSVRRIIEALGRERPAVLVATLSDAAAQRDVRGLDTALEAMLRGSTEGLYDLVAAIEAPGLVTVPALLAMLAAGLRMDNAEEAWLAALRQLLSVNAEAARAFIAEAIESEPERLSVRAGPMLQDILAALVPHAAPALGPLAQALMPHAARIGLDRHDIVLGMLSETVRLDQHTTAGASGVIRFLRNVVGDTMLASAAAALQQETSIRNLPSAAAVALAQLASGKSVDAQATESLRRDLKLGMQMRAVLRTSVPPKSELDDHDSEWLFRVLSSGDLTQLGRTSELPQRLESLLDTLLHDRDPKLARRLAIFLRKSANRTKLIRTLPERLLARLILQASPGRGAPLLKAGELLAEAAFTAGAKLDRATFWEAHFETAAAPDTGDVGALSERLFAATGRATSESDARARESLGAALLGAAMRIARDAGEAALLTALEARRPALLSAFAHARRASTARAGQVLRARKGTPPLKGGTDFGLDSREESLKDQPTFIANAGLVLANPFLPLLFERLALMLPDEDGKLRLVGDQAASRAVHLLQYLADEHTDRPEPLLVFNKILCGVPVPVPVERAIEMTDAERETCDELLRAMVEHWPMIHGTSAAGLRETFLQREGKLVRRDDGWHLQVQRKTVDILMEQLPWSIGVVFHPWMPAPVHVTW